MFVSSTKRPNGEYTIEIKQGYRVNGKVRARRYYVGTLSKLEKIHPNFLELFKEKIKNLKVNIDNNNNGINNNNTTTNNNNNSNNNSSSLSSLPSSSTPDFLIFFPNLVLNFFNMLKHWLRSLFKYFINFHMFLVSL